ncbi:phosphate ABC transporter substrate-binding protein (PhoT family) [Sinobaca qinghaiensis]|uniref:Phosphate-binding protein n=1 Tax=Sinobaca qinghaiensis TaxID=342944 RepID=A0A419V6R5_9BACL|nr:PstS family phosphate ABC transporter substrate-binding protein [Sinobaca qinghaiensis]RKD75659.1 phosphate ABC transporter substrate-binding protein (PhoT family) [Sinobaca qinghaiensis]
MRMKKGWMALSLAGLMAVSACGGGGEETEEEASGSGEGSGEEAASGEGENEIAIDGSSTVFPIMEAVSEEYQAENPDIRAPIGVSGSGGGFERFIGGETDLSNASRDIEDEEVEQLEEAGIDYIELPLAYDGLSVVVSQENDFIDSLTVEELQTIFMDGEAETWSDVNSEWPDEPIERFSPGTDSGTFDYFVEEVLEDGDISRDAQLSEDDNVLVTGVQSNPNAIAYFGYAYYAENQDSLKIVPIDNGDGPIEPTEETINDGTYEPLSRPLFTYVKTESLQEEHILDYVNFTNENAGELALEVGYINLTDEEYEENAQMIEEAAADAE